MKDLIAMAMVCATVAICVLGFLYFMNEAGKAATEYRTACLEAGGTIDGWNGTCVP